MNPRNRGLNLEMDALDSLAVAKACIRGASLVVIGLLALRLQAQMPRSSLQSRFFPLALFALWAIASTFWSPMKAVSLGHGCETLMLVLLAMCTAYLVQEEAQVSRLLCHIVCMILVLLTATLILNADAILSGQRMVEYVHPNTSGSIASIALTILITGRLATNWRWTRLLLIPGLAVFLAAEYAAESRSAIISGGIVLSAACWRFRKSVLIVIVCLACGLWTITSPYLDAASKLPDSIQKYVMRGQTEADAKTLSGRTELWDIGVEAFLASPIYGHGYYAMTDTGFMNVWRGKRWQTAHNSYLHVLTGTGLIGCFLLTTGLLWILVPLKSLKGSRPAGTAIVTLVFLLVIYYLLLGLFELSFAGPVDPTSVTFYLVLGIAGGRLALDEQRRRNPLRIYRRPATRCVPSATS